MPRFHVDQPLRADLHFDLPPGAARHVQVLRLQPGAAITLFDGRGGEWSAEVRRMGRQDVAVQVLAQVDAERELPLAVTLALGMPANDRMDDLVEKATELGVAAIQPLLCERSVLRLSGERAAKKVQHWRGVAVAACEQSGRTRLPQVHEVQSLPEWLRGVGDAGATGGPLRVMLSLSAGSQPFDAAGGAAGGVLFLSGPDGGLSVAEEAAARAAGFAPVSLGARVLRADTAPLAALAALAIAHR